MEMTFNDLLDSDERFKVQEAVRLLLYSLAGVKLDSETIQQCDKLFKMIREKKKGGIT